MTNNQWLNDLKPGDEVARELRGWGNHLHVDFLTVKRRTPTLIICGTEYSKTYEQKFRVSDGYEPGGGMYMLRQSTPELKERLAEQTRRQELLKRIDAIKWNSVKSDTLDAVLALVAPKEN